MKDLSVLTKKDHELAVGFQKRHGISLGDFLKILSVGTIAVDSHNDNSKISVAYEKVVPNLADGTWDFAEPKPEIGKGRDMSDLGETYTIDAPEMEAIAVKKRRDEVTSLYKAAEALVAAKADKATIAAVLADAKAREAAIKEVAE